MDIGELQRLAPYRHLDRSMLAGVARHCREVIIPAARWLLRPGGRLHGACYLLAGTAELAAPALRLHLMTHRTGPVSLRYPFPEPGWPEVLSRVGLEPQREKDGLVLVAPEGTRLELPLP